MRRATLRHPPRLDRCQVKPLIARRLRCQQADTLSVKSATMANPKEVKNCVMRSGTSTAVVEHKKESMPRHALLAPH